MAWAHMMRREAARLAGRGLDLLCPARCAVCGADVAAGIPDACPPGPTTCAACRRMLVGPDRCTRCGGSCAAGTCRARAEWDGIVVLGGYGDDLRHAVLRAKRPGGEPLAAASSRPP